MTDSIIQFNYSDGVFMTAIYIKSDSHQDTFIPQLFNIIKTCEYTNKRRGWAYVVAEIVSNLVEKYEGLVKFILESQIEPSHVIYKYSITVENELYNNESNKLVDFLKIKYFDEEEGFDGLLKDFEKSITLTN